MHPYLPHVLYSIALTSLSTHLLFRRKAVAEERAQLAARVSILESIAYQLRSPTPLSDDDLEKLKRLARVQDQPVDATPTPAMGWKDVVLGKRTVESSGDMSEWEKKDLENVQREIESTR